MNTPIPPKVFHISQQVLERLAGKALFYPHCGHDWKTPISIFAPYIADFLLADIGFFSEGFKEETYTPLLSEYHSLYRFESKEIEGNPDAQLERRQDPISDQFYDWLEPFTVRETYTHIPTGKQFRVHRLRRLSYSAFKNETYTLGVFFYRGDSPEGSNIPWLTTVDPTTGRFWGEVLEKLDNGGLVVTDGARMEHGRDRRVYGQLSPRWQDIKEESAKEVMANARDFVDKSGRLFQCIGYAGRDTLIWQVTKPE